MNYIYSTDPKGIAYRCRANAVHGDAQISIEQTIKASSHKEAAEQFEEYLSEHHEGHEWAISIMSPGEIKNANNAGYAA